MAVHLHALPTSQWKTWPHPDGDIDICRTADNTTLWTPHGRSYRPAQVYYLRIVTWTIREGTGLISINGTECPYKPGDIFELRFGGTYSLSRIDTHTVVETKYRYFPPYHHA